MMVLLRSKSESRMGALAWQLHSAPQHAHCSSLQRCLGPGPTQSRKETRLKVGWITAGGGGVGDTGNSRETRLCGSLSVAHPPDGCPCQGSLSISDFPSKGGRANLES